MARDETEIGDLRIEGLYNSEIIKIRNNGEDSDHEEHRENAKHKKLFKQTAQFNSIKEVISSRRSTTERSDSYDLDIPESQRHELELKKQQLKLKFIEHKMKKQDISSKVCSRQGSVEKTYQVEDEKKSDLSLSRSQSPVADRLD